MKDIQRIRPLTTGPIESSVRSRQAETSALVQSTPYPKPRQQLISRTPKKSPLPFLVRQLIIKQELPRNKYQDHVNNTKTILIYHVGLFAFLFITTSTQLHREFVMTTLGKRWSPAPTIIHGVEYLIFVFLISGLLRLWYVNYQWKKEENRIAEIRAKIEKELDESTDAPIINPVTNGSNNQVSRLTNDLSRTYDSTTILPNPTVPTSGTASVYAGLSTSTAGPFTSTIGPSTSTIGPSTSTIGPSTSTIGPSTSTIGPSSSTIGPSSSTIGPSTSTIGPSTFTSPSTLFLAQNRALSSQAPISFTNTNIQSTTFAPNAWLRDGSPVQVKVPHAKYRTTPFATPMASNERSVSIKRRVHGGLPPDPDPDEGIEY